MTRSMCVETWRMTRSRWRGCESLQEMKVRFAPTLLPLCCRHYHAGREYHTLGLINHNLDFKISGYRILIQNYIDFPTI